MVKLLGLSAYFLSLFVRLSHLTQACIGRGEISRFPAEHSLMRGIIPINGFEAFTWLIR